MNRGELQRVLEVVLLGAERPVSVDELVELVSVDAGAAGREAEETVRAGLREEVRQALRGLAEECAERGVELGEVSSGFRYQVKPSFAHWVSRLHAERPARYSRALLETLALIAYRQPVTRGEIEEVRGVGVSASIMRTLQDREWIRVLGHREVPGRPAMYGTTRKFLDDFNLKRLDELPPLAEMRDLESLHADLFTQAPLEAPGQLAESPSGNAEHSEVGGSSETEGSQP